MPVPAGNRLNEHLSDDVRRLFFADLDHDNMDDIIKLEVQRIPYPYGMVQETSTWYVSDDGRARWRELKKYRVSYFIAASPVGGRVFGFAGRFGTAPGGGVLLIGHDRLGRFFSEAEIATGVPAGLDEPVCLLIYNCSLIVHCPEVRPAA